MRNLLLNLLLLIYTPFIFTGCSLMTDNDTAQKQPVTIENAQTSPAEAAEPHDQNTLQGMSLSTTPASNEPIGGSLEKSMDSDDKIKMSRALDKAPGRTTSWTNNRNGIHYEVTPIRKIVVKENPFCRSYRMTGTRGSYNKEVSGTACVSEDGNWHPM